MAHFSRPDVAYVDFDFPRPDRRSPRLRPIWAVLRMVGLTTYGCECDEENCGHVSPEMPFALERTRHGWHVIIKLREKLSDAETVALQLALGDDGRRGALNLMRAIFIRKNRNTVTPHWKKRWNILYSSKLD